MTGKLKKILLFSAFALLLFFAGAFLTLAPMGKTETAKAGSEGGDIGNIAEGTCGDNITWKIIQEEGGDYVLTISGTGAMTDFTANTYKNAGYFTYASSINRVVIEDGVTSVGSYAFYGASSGSSSYYPNLTRVELGSVTSIGRNAFSCCALTGNLVIPNTVTSLGIGAFSSNSISSVTIPTSVSD